MYILLATIIEIFFIASFVLVRKNIIKITYLSKRIMQITFAIILLYCYVFFIIDRGSKGQWFHLGAGDLCPFMALVLILPLFFNWETVIKAIAPWAFLGAILTIYTASPFKWISLPPYEMATTIPRHLTLLSIGLSAPLLLNNYTKKDIRNVLIFIALFMLYNLIFTNIFAKFDWRFKIFSTGLFKESYTAYTNPQSGETWASYVFLGKIGLGPYPLPSIIFYVFDLIMLSGLIWVNDKVVFYINQDSKKATEIKHN